MLYKVMTYRNEEHHHARNEKHGDAVIKFDMFHILVFNAILLS